MAASAPIPAPSLAPPDRGRRLFLLLAILVLALGVRVWKLDQKNLWIDEGVSWETAVYPFSGVVAMAAGDIHPPLYYFLLKGWIALTGESPIALRSLSVLFGLIALVLAHRLASRWLAPAASLGVLLWLAISPHMVGYSQEARMYTATMVAVLTAALGYRAWVSSGFRKTWALAGVVVAASAGMYLHYFTMLFVLALWLHLLAISFRPSRPSGAPPSDRLGAGWRQWTLANVALAVMYLPWASTAFAQVTKGQSWRQPITLADLPLHASAFWKEIWLGLHYGWPASLTIAAGIVTVLSFAGWTALAWRTVRRGRSDADLFIFLVGAVPAIVALALMPLSGQMQLSRYLGYTAPFLAIGAVRGWSAFLPARVVGLLIGLCIAGSGVWLNAYFGDASKDTDVRPVASAILVDLDQAKAQGQTTGAVLIQPGYMKVLIAYYTRGRDIVFPDVPSDATLSSVIDGAVATSQGAPIWLVIEGRWAGFRSFDGKSDPRLTEVLVPGGRPQDIRMFRIGR